MTEEEFLQYLLKDCNNAFKNEEAMDEVVDSIASDIKERLRRLEELEFENNGC